MDKGNKILRKKVALMGQASAVVTDLLRCLQMVPEVLSELMTYILGLTLKEQGGLTAPNVASEQGHQQPTRCCKWQQLRTHSRH